MPTNLTLHQLQVFEEVIEAEGFSAACSRLDMTQPAISMQIRKLEDAIGSKVFEKHARKLELTSVGERIHEYSKKIHSQHQGLQEAIYEINNLGHGHINVSAATTANHFIVNMLAEFSKEYPNISVNLDITNRKALIQQLEKYQPNLVIMGEPPSNLGLKSEILMNNPLVVIAPTSHPLVGQSKISFEKIKDEEFVVREAGSGTKAAIEKFFSQHGSDFKSKMAMGSNEAIRHAVMAGLGLGIVSLHTIKLELKAERLAILNVEHFPIERHWHIVKREDKNMPPAAEKFQNFIQSKALTYAKSFQAFIH